MKNNKGWTIVQRMIFWMIAGVVAYLVVDIIIDRRCEAEPWRPVCADR